ncbi:MAG: hydrolase 2, exosortase system-associated [Massilia sp.]|nr:hydrolase 2, exosortase system-associated [Massilia sp.]
MTRETRETSKSHAQGLFLDAAPGQRFGLFHPPAGACRGAVLYVHPFGDEMNKSRRMAALQARALAAAGFGVLQLDLYGCGDSSGEFRDARWALWKQDVAAASAWLGARLGQPVSVWGLRLGALLALDYAHDAHHAPYTAVPVAGLVLWQPVLSGSTFLTQFLRLRVAGDMLAHEPGREASATGTAALRAALAAGETLEIGGYELAPALAAAIDALDAGVLLPACPVAWFEVVAQDGRQIGARSAKLQADWQARGIDLKAHVVAGKPFWATQEISESAALVDATLAALTGAAHA